MELSNDDIWIVQEVIRAPRGRSACPSPDSLVGDDNYASDDGVEIVNDPDIRYCIDNNEVIDLDGSERPNITPIVAAHQKFCNANPAHDPSSCVDGDYITNKQIGVLSRTQNKHHSPEQPVTPCPKDAQIEIQNIGEACVDGIVYKPGQSVELVDGTFLRITAVLNGPDGLFLDGRRLWRTKHRQEIYIPKHRNEVIWIIDGTDTDNLGIPLSHVKRFFKIIFTNWCNIETDSRRHNCHSRDTVFCRLKQILVSSDEISVQFLTYDEADEQYRDAPSLLRHLWRGETLPFGDGVTPWFHQVAIDLDGTNSTVIDLTMASDRRQYTFGDGFCGAGGVSRGAERAGLQIKWAFDNNKHAVTSYRLNYKNASCEQSDIFLFLTNSPEFLRVDVSHGSPPCQTFSPAHTIAGPNDEANSACIFSCADLVRKAKPRIHTMEETCGLYERHKETFDRIIQDFIEMGYSVRWGILNCMHYGVPQTRRRLILIASGPGETLPIFPKPTHGLPGSGLLPINTIRHLISNIPPGTPDHDVQGALERWERTGLSRAPFNADQPAGTITCNGGEKNYHPSGKRHFTNREFACLQTFPYTHRFGPHEVRKQIGNAVPPILAKAIYREIIKSLRQTDDKELEAARDS